MIKIFKNCNRNENKKAEDGGGDGEGVGDGVEAGAVRGCWCGSVPVPGGVWRGGQLQRRTSQPSVDSGQQTIAHRHTHTLVTS